MSYAPTTANRTANSSAFRVLFTITAVLVIFLGAMDPAYAQGLEKANTLLDAILAFLRVASIAIVTIAIIIAGYKFAFQKAELSEVMKIVGGGILIGGSAEFARFLLQ